jgi:hypothetical protein
VRKKELSWLLPAFFLQGGKDLSDRTRQAVLNFTQDLPFQLEEHRSFKEALEDLTQQANEYAELVDMQTYRSVPSPDKEQVVVVHLSPSASTPERLARAEKAGHAATAALTLRCREDIPVSDLQWARDVVTLSTSDCKAMWLGHSANRLATVFSEARAMQPTLLFIDEMDAVCPPRGSYADAISREFSAQLLQEVDGLLSDSQAVFLVGATNRLDWVDTAILSRFAEKMEIPLPDELARQALLKVFLAPIRFAGDREQIIRALAQSSNGQSGRDLRARVNRAVLAAVKRTTSPKDLTLIEKDFAPF